MAETVEGNSWALEGASETELFVNPRCAPRTGPPPPSLESCLPAAGGAAARAAIRAWNDYSPTPLVGLPALAAALGLGEVLYKDESPRFGLGAFKALGGGYAVFKEVQRRTLGSDAAPGAAPTPNTTTATHPPITFACATAGNHGRAVAWGARRFGAAAQIYMHSGVPQSSVDAVAALGAHVTRTPGGYDASVEALAADAARQGWIVVADTAAEGGEGVDIPRDVMQGYTLAAAEALEQARAGVAEGGGQGTPPPVSHIFVQAGVGGLAAAVTRVAWDSSSPPPRVVVVEPSGAACLLASARAGERVELEGPLVTDMVCLACGSPSAPAWPALRDGVSAFVAVTDAAGAHARRLLAAGAAGPRLAPGPSGVTSVAGLIALAARPEARAALGLDANSRVLVFGTEGTVIAP